ncbi:MAG: hypothetical protein CVT75_04460 [Alphaproteobacteria bacterium HGW-Alphaproteobacteria-14]|nr:MAG: hypothetical protein CVT75_04460 [Alphaproteobacteria bacterium HGW-Alphaproteobacteria-14]
MTRSLTHVLMLLAALVAAWQPSKAIAADEDTQLWQYFVVTGDLDQDTSLTIDASHRWREQARGGDQQTIRFTILQAVADGVRIGGGGAVFDAGGNTEIRSFQQAVVRRGRVQARTRFEQRFFDGADRVELRLRQRIQYSQPIGNGWSASLGGEWIGLLQSRNAGQGASTEQWRAQTGIAYRISDRLELGANYWLVVFPRRDLPARISHVPQTALTYRF